MGDIKQDCVRIVPALIRLRAALISPQARCHFSLNNSYEEHDSSFGFVSLLQLLLTSLIQILFYILSFNPLLFLWWLKRKSDAMLWLEFFRIAHIQAMQPLAVSRLRIKWEGPPGKYYMAAGRSGPGCNIDGRGSHVVVRKTFGAQLVCWLGCLWSPRNKQCKQMLCSLTPSIPGNKTADWYDDDASCKRWWF